MDVPRFGVEVETDRSVFQSSTELFTFFRGVARSAIFHRGLRGDTGLDDPNNIVVQPHVSTSHGTQYILTTSSIKDGFNLQERQFRLGIVDDMVEGTIRPTLVDLDTDDMIHEDVTPYLGLLEQMKQAYLYDKRHLN